MTVGIAMIVRDEAAVLTRCLDAVRPHVDELVIVDTGSVDETGVIARRYTDRVLDFAWVDDFTLARQYAFDQVESDWVCWLDADEIMRGGEHLRPLLAGLGDEIGVVSCRCAWGFDAWGAPSLTYWRERCVRNNGSYRWAGAVHEVLIARDDTPPRQTYCAETIVIEHRPEARGGDPAPRRNLDILERQVANTDTPEPRLLYYLAREYADHGEYEPAIAAFERYLAIATWQDERYLAQTQVAGLHRRLGRYDAAIDADLRALAIHPRWPEAYFGLAESYYHLRGWPKVIHWVELGRQLPPPETPLFLDKARYRYGWIIYYTNALYHLGRIDEALRWTRIALGYDPDDPYHRENLRLFNRLAAPDL